MPQRTPEERREYMREYRSRKRSIPEIRDAKWAEMQVAGGADPEAIPERTPKPAVAAPAPAPKKMRVYKTPEAAEETLSAIRRQRTGNALPNPYEDGLPDWPDIIWALSQQQRDAILSRLGVKGKQQ